MRHGSFFLDLAGIEPASESLSLEASPITATPFTFPHPTGEQRPSGFSSFIIRLQTQSFACIVSRNNDAGYRRYGYDRADGCDYAATATVLSAFNFKVPVLSWSGPRMASSTSKPPSKPVQALVNKSLNSLLLNHKTQARSINRRYNFQGVFPVWVIQSSLGNKQSCFLDFFLQTLTHFLAHVHHIHIAVAGLFAKRLLVELPAKVRPVKSAVI